VDKPVEKMLISANEGFCPNLWITIHRFLHRFIHRWSAVIPRGLLSYQQNPQPYYYYYVFIYISLLIQDPGKGVGA
jgi:hypothetical protein